MQALYGIHKKHLVGNVEFYFKIAEFHAIKPVRILMILRPWVITENTIKTNQKL